MTGALHARTMRAEAEMEEPMRVNIKSSLKKQSITKTRLSKDIFKYIMYEIVDLREETEAKQIHGKVNLRVRFEAGRDVTHVDFEIVFEIKDLAGFYEYRGRFDVEDVRPPEKGAFCAAVLDHIKQGLAMNDEKHSTTMAAIRRNL